MRYSRFFIPTLKEVPADASIASHRLMLRAGLIRQMGSGIYAWLPLGLRALTRLVALVREEMDRAGAVEFQQPLLIQRELWEETGRYALLGDLMMKVHDRAGKDFVLAPTHEEGFTHLVRGELRSYRELPLTVYQIAKKFRDEIRPRFGVMRGREFLMKDAYSFDRDEADLDRSYEAMRTAYSRVFRRVALPAVGVKADSGAMGGSGSEEFMVPSEIGEDEIIVCSGCGYAANTETAVCSDGAVPSGGSDTPARGERATPGVRTIEQLCGFFSLPAARFLKALVYLARQGEEESPVVVLIRGDLDVNEIKLANRLGADGVRLAEDPLVLELTGGPTGFVGPVGLSGVRMLADLSVATLHDAVCGANRLDTHFEHVEPGRDFPLPETCDLRQVRAGDLCAACGAALRSFRGIEVGHVFKLGDKYTRAMGVSYLDENGSAALPIMGCYGIGVDRTLASAIEQHHDGDGIIWPATIAPFDVMLVPVNYGEAGTREAADRLYDALMAAGLTVLLDDRDARPGVKFKDADLIGLPIRVTIGEKGLAKGEIEVRRRDSGVTVAVPVAETAAAVQALHRELLAALSG